MFRKKSNINADEVKKAVEASKKDPLSLRKM
jgi:hypothetical protein